MSSIGSLDATGAGITPVQASIRPPANASGELAKCESQLSDWVHCASSKTPEGKAKIAEITGKIDAIKAQMKKAEEASTASAAPASAPTSETTPRLRFDGLGAKLNVQA